MRILSTLAIMLFTISVRAQIITGPITVTSNQIVSAGGVIAANNGSDFSSSILTSSNIAIMMLSPVAGNNAWTDKNGKTGSYDHQIGEAWYGSLTPIHWWWNSAGSTFRGDFTFASPINAGDQSKSETNGNASAQWIWNGHPLLWNKSGDAYFQAANMSTNSGSSGSGFGSARIGIVAGVPTIIDSVAAAWLLTTTNVTEGLLPGWYYSIVNYGAGSGVIGTMFGGTTGVGPDTGNYGYFYCDNSNALLRIPLWVSGAHTPATNTWKDVMTVNMNTGTINLGRSNAFVNVTNFNMSPAAITAAGSGNPFHVGTSAINVDNAENVGIGNPGANTANGNFARILATGGTDNQYEYSGGNGMGIDTFGNVHLRTGGTDRVGIANTSFSAEFQQSKWAIFTDTGMTNMFSVWSAGGFGSTLSNKLAPAAISFPATTVPWTNTQLISIEVYIDNTAVTGTAIKKNGTTIFSGLSADVTIGLQRGEYFSETYTVGTPSATWSPFP